MALDTDNHSQLLIITRNNTFYGRNRAINDNGVARQGVSPSGVGR